MDNRNCRDFYDFKENEDAEGKSDYLGEGGFATVYKAIKKDTKEKRALKIIKKRKIIQILKELNKKEPTEDDINNFYKDIHKEIEFMKSMKGKNDENKNTVKFYEYCHNSFEFVIVMELCDESLNDFLIRRKHFDSNEIYKMLTQLNKSFKRMNQLHLVHRDLTINNVLLKYKNKELTKNIIKLCDYGISKRSINISNFHTQKGTLRFMAPEVMIGTYKEECDLWSLGIMIHLLYYNNYPFDGEQPLALYNQIQESNLQINTGNIYLDDLITRLLTPSPDQRLKWKDYFKHDFFIANLNYIVIKLKVTESDKKENENEFENIYFFDNDIFMKRENEFNYEENKEIKELIQDNNIEIYINNNKMDECKKYFQPEKEGEYEIKIIFLKKWKIVVICLVVVEI